MANETIGGLFRLFAGNAGRHGTFTLNGTTPVVVSNRFITGNSVIESTIKTPAGTPGTRVISAVTPGQSFTITGSSATDTSVYNYVVFL